MRAVATTSYRRLEPLVFLRQERHRVQVLHQEPERCRLLALELVQEPLVRLRQGPERPLELVLEHPCRELPVELLLAHLPQVGPLDSYVFPFYYVNGL